MRYIDDLDFIRFALKYPSKIRLLGDTFTASPMPSMKPSIYLRFSSTYSGWNIDGACNAWDGREILSRSTQQTWKQRWMVSNLATQAIRKAWNLQRSGSITFCFSSTNYLPVGNPVSSIYSALKELSVPKETNSTLMLALRDIPGTADNNESPARQLCAVFAVVWLFRSTSVKTLT